MSSSEVKTKRVKYSILPRMKKKAGDEHGCDYHIAAAGFNKKGRLVGVKYNSHRDGLSNGYGAGLHAEVNLIHSFGNQIDTIYLLRTNESGKMLPIHPCKVCAKIAAKRGIKIIPLHIIYGAFSKYKCGDQYLTYQRNENECIFHD